MAELKPCPLMAVSKKTNAERIRKMTDAELAKELARVASWDRKQYRKAKGIGIEKVMLDWLQGECYEAN